MEKKRSTCLKTSKKATGFHEYRLSKFIYGITYTTIVNFIIGMMLKEAFDPIAIIGMFFLTENLFVCILIISHNYKNIVYLNNEVEKLKKEIQYLKGNKKETIKKKMYSIEYLIS